MAAANTAMTFIMGIITQIMGWINSLFGAIVPSSTDATGKSQFMKWGVIVVLVYFAAQIFRFKISTGTGGRK